MTLYHVSWEIEIDADSPEQAAEEALDIQQDPESTATLFLVTHGTRQFVVDVSDDIDCDATVQ